MQADTFHARLRSFIVLLLTLGLAGCALGRYNAGVLPTTEATLFPTITLIPSETWEPTVTPIPDLPTSTANQAATLIEPPAPGSTPSETPSATSTPAAEAGQTDTPLAPTGPTATSTRLPVGRLTGGLLGLIPSPHGLWAMRADGSRVTLLTTDPIFQLSVSPTGWAAAYVTNSSADNLALEKPYGFTLKIITLYNDRIITVTPLNPSGLGPDSSPDALDSAYQFINSYNIGAMAWSADGLNLAFASEHEAPNNQAASSDIYIYTLSSGKINRLTQLKLPEGPAHPYALSWAPYGQRLYYAAAYNFGTGTDFWMAGAWIAGLNGTSMQVAAAEATSDEGLLTWISSGTALVFSKNGDCGIQNLRLVNVTSGTTTPLWQKCYATAVYDRPYGNILISVTPDQAGQGGENPPGLYLVSIGQPRANALSNHGFERIYTANNFNSDRAAWYGFNRGEGLFVIQRSGQINPLFTGEPFDGSNGASFRPLFRLQDAAHPANGSWLWTGDGLFVCSPGAAPREVTAATVDSVTISPTVGGMLFFLAPDQDITRLFAVRASDWKPFIVDPRISDPQEIDWTGQ